MEVGLKRTLLLAVPLLALVGVLWLLLGDGGDRELGDVRDGAGGPRASLRVADVQPRLGTHEARPGGSSQASLALAAEAWTPPAGALTGRVVDESGRPLAGVDVALRPDSPPPRVVHARRALRGLRPFVLGADRGAAVTDAEGRYALEEAPDGLQWIIASKAGYVRAQARVHLRRGLPAQGPVDLVLRGGKSVRGRVQDARGRGEAGVVVVQGGMWHGGPSHAGAVTETDADGAWASTVHPDTSSEFLVMSRDASFAVKAFSAADPAIVHWPDTVPVEIRFVRQGDKQPVAGASIELLLGIWHDQHAVAWGDTDETGTLRLDLPRCNVQEIHGRHPTFGRFAFGFPSHPSQMGSFEWLPREDGEPLVLTVVGASEASLTGVVATPEGEPVVGALVVLRPPGWAVAYARTDTEGRYVIREDPKELVLRGTLLVLARGFAPYRAELAAVAQRDRTADVALSRGVTVVGRVVDDRGVPVAGARVDAAAHRVRLVLEQDLLSDIADEDRAMVREGGLGPFRGAPATLPIVWTGPEHAMDVLTDAEGRYVLGGLPAGATTLHARHSRAGQPAAAEIEVGRRALQRAPDLVLPRGRAVRVRVLDPDGHPLAGAEVALIPGDLAKHMRPVDMVSPPVGLRARVTGADGFVHFDRVGLGTHTLQAFAEGTAGAIRGLNVGAEEATAATMRLRPEAVIEGRIVDPKGRRVTRTVQFAIEDVRREAPEDPTSWLPHALFHVTGDGTFQIRGLPAGLQVTFETHSDYYLSSSVSAHTGQRGVMVRLAPYAPGAYEAVMQAADALAAARAEPRPRQAAAAAAHDERIRKLEAAHAAAVRHYVGHGGASCGGRGTGCG